MAERPIFVPATSSSGLVEEVFFEISWHAGFSTAQKQRNIDELHATARSAGFLPLLEVSTKSKAKAGRHLSAFHLRVRSARHGDIPLECAFQGSKVFEHGGPFTDLYTRDAKEAKRDERLRSSGQLIGFQFEGLSFPIEPKTVFYDWLYATSLFPHREWCKRLYLYAGFTDIEFNPHRSINCQARSCALFLTLMKRKILDHATESPENFLEVISHHDYKPELVSNAQTQREFSVGQRSR